jgi:hypothetical protein
MRFEDYPPNQKPTDKSEFDLFDVITLFNWAVLSLEEPLPQIELIDDQIVFVIDGESFSFRKPKK